MVKGGLDAVNISLDTLIEPKFELITRRRGFSRVMDCIEQAAELQAQGKLRSVKVNCVMMRGVNDDEIIPFVEFAMKKKLNVRFIEYMPFDGNRWSDNKFVSYMEMLDVIKKQFPSFHRRREEDKPNDTSKAWKIEGEEGSVGFITSMSQHFCGSCNRLRITADGSIKVCLFGNEEVSLRDRMRSGDDDEELLDVVHAAVWRKAAKHGGKGDMHALASSKNRPMIKIGG
uniref:Radical SAM core domain-containing protein n=1 Tax=Hanusia phi TaxID=3032 RepID=A0A7S0HAA9_9CRYP|mmetsp:Transcript_13088/g.30105  ORF Transcript_13088/g.30105 Transcript_13088/m.30105 type:complete len:229 (+) Transcript_13088:2-688(+)